MKRHFVLALGLIGVGCFATTSLAQSGHMLTGFGAINESMGGAAVGKAVDATGALHWNPASIGAFRNSEGAFSLQGFRSNTQLSSTVNANSFGAGVPGATLSGETRSDIGIQPIPTMALVCQKAESRWVCGLGAFGIGGFGVDYPADSTNPITTPQPPNGFGFGAIYSSFQMLQVSPTIAYRVTDRLSVGFAPSLNWASLAVSPFSAVGPDDANGDGSASYPSAARSSTSLGYGFQFGVYYERENSWSFGFSYKSTQWLEDFEFNSTNEVGSPRQFDFDLDVPSIASVGVGYSGFESLDLALDARYVDYEHTDGFERTGFDGIGAVRGFNWSSIVVVAAGLQYHLTETTSIRLGYSYNDNPVDRSDTFFNVAAPGIVQHHANVGVSVSPAESVTLSLAYHHGFKNSISGPWYGPSGPIAGTRVKSELETDSITLGLRVRF